MPAGSGRKPSQRANSRRRTIAEAIAQKRCLSKSIELLSWSREQHHRWLVALQFYRLETQDTRHCDPRLTTWKTGRHSVARADTHTYVSSTALSPVHPDLRGRSRYEQSPSALMAAERDVMNGRLARWRLFRDWKCQSRATDSAEASKKVRHPVL